MAMVFCEMPKSKYCDSNLEKRHKICARGVNPEIFSEDSCDYPVNKIVQPCHELNNFHPITGGDKYGKTGKEIQVWSG